MNHTIIKKIVSSEKSIFLLGISIISLLIYLLSFQGFDVCDEGWYLTFYQQIFNAPETIEYNFAFWLTGIIGGIWNYMYSEGGIHYFRLLTIVVLIPTIGLTYKVLINYINYQTILLGVFITAFINNYGHLLFYYNHLSSLLLLLCVFLLLEGIKKKKHLYFFLAGLFTALNVFSRLPNLTLFIFIILIPLQSFWNNKKTPWFHQAFAFVIGSVLGFSIVYLTMYKLEHLEIMKNAFLGIVNKGTNSDSNHNLLQLVKSYIINYKYVFIHGIKFLSILVIFIIGWAFLKKIKILKIVWSIFMFSVITYLFSNNTIFIFYFICIVCNTAILFSTNSPIHVKNIAFSALLIMVLLPIGSDNGVSNVGYVSLWIAVPMSINFIAQNFESITKFISTQKQLKISISSKELQQIGIIIITSYILAKSYGISNNSYFDTGNRFLKTSSINSKLAKGIKTTKNRANIINPLLLELDNHVSKNDYLFAYDNIPMINYLTYTKPYLYNSWVWVYDSTMFKTQLDRAEIEIENLPIVVLQKFQTIGSFSEPELNYMSEEKQENYIYKKGRTIAMNDFLNRNEYHIVWSNDHFNILKSQKK